MNIITLSSSEIETHLSRRIVVFVNFVSDDFPNRLGIGVLGGAEVHAKMSIVIVGLISTQIKMRMKT
jgi:hypothetical protein